MCGIAGKISFDHKPVSSALLKGMCDVIMHRGPDEEGFYVQGNVGLGMRRLSIIDLAGGSQPIHNEDKSIWTVFNGEIYNHKELRAELQKKGHTFYTNADTEIIVHLYEEHGERFVERLNGMFGIAVWDKKRRKLVLARDRIGIKPLAYYFDNKRLIFGSEIKSILVDPSIHRKLHLQAVDYYFTHGYVPAPHAIFVGISKLPPGHLLICENGRIDIQRYWDLCYERNGQLGEQEYAEQIRSLLKASVKRRLMSDVPLGAFLSGGIDSSAVVAMMSELMDRPVKTFSIGFEESKYNELDDARLVANHLKTEHTELIVRPNAVELLPELVRAYDEPFADSSAIPTYYVSKLAREHVTVALSGDGGDELFGGYTRYIEDHKDAFFSKLPYFLRTGVLAEIGRRMPQNMRTKKYLEYIGKSDEERFFQRAGIFPLEWKRLVYSEDVRSELHNVDAYDLSWQYLNRPVNSAFQERLLYLDLKMYLPFDILTKVDIASMLNSLEVRVPLLDHELVEFVATIPLSLKIRRRNTKYIFKRAISQLLPAHVFTKRKQGFAIPLEHWFRHELKDFTYDTLTSQAFRKRGLLNPGQVESLFQQHAKGRGDYSSLIWTVLTFELWCNQFMDAGTFHSHQPSCAEV